MNDNKKAIIAIVAIILVIIGLIIAIVCVSGKNSTSGNSSQNESGGTEYGDNNNVNAEDLFGNNKNSEADKEGSSVDNNDSDNIEDNDNTSETQQHMGKEEVDTSQGWGDFN